MGILSRSKLGVLPGRSGGLGGAKKNRVLNALFCLILLLAACATHAAEIDVFSGAANRPFLEKAAEAFRLRTGIRVSLNFGGSGAVLSQMILSRRGDVYVAASEYFMSIALQKGAIKDGTVQTLACLIPVIVVVKGNPNAFLGLRAPARPCS